MQVVECSQGTEEWLKARMRMPTASMFNVVQASGIGGGDSKTRRTYMYQLAGEIITGEPCKKYTNEHMERGHEQEPEARAAYEFISGNDCQEVGFIKNLELGCGSSPDSLINPNGCLEIKTKLPHLQIELILADKVPTVHIAQIQGHMWIAEREWCDFFSYYPRMPHFLKRVYRDDKYINGTLWPAISKFNEELNKLLERLK